MVDAVGDARPEGSDFLPLVGRERELQTLQLAFQRALDRRGGLVLVSGEAGIGKTSLVQAFMDEAAQCGPVLLRGHCYDLTTTPPYGLWLELTDRYKPEEGMPRLPDVLRRGTGVAALQNQLALFEVARDFIYALSDERPLIIVLEDVHWADQASLDLLRYLARQVDDHRILIVAVYRDDEVTRQHPLFTLLPALIRESQATRIALTRLIRDDIQTMVAERWTLTDEDQTRLVDYLLEHAEGHPLFTVEVLRTLDQNRFIFREKDAWRLADLSQVPLPSLVLQVIEGRMAQLGDESRYYLEVAAVIGQQVALDVWKHVASMCDDELLALLRRAISLHLLEPSSDENLVTFVHALTRQALYESMLPPQRRLWHRLIAEKLAGSPNPDPDTISYHFQRAGDERAIDWLICSGNRAEMVWALQTASDRFESAQLLMAQDEARTEMRGWLLFRLARTIRFTGHERALACLQEAERIAEVVGNRTLAIAAIAERGFVYSCMGRPSDGLDEITRALNEYDRLTSEKWEVDRAQFLALFSMNPELEHVGFERDLAVVMESRRTFIMQLLAIAGQFHRSLDLRKVWEPHWTGRLLSGTRVNALGGWVKSELALGRPGNVHDDHRELIRRSIEINNFIVAASDVFNYLHWWHLPYNADDLEEREQLFSQMLELFTLADKHGNAAMPPAASHQHPFQFWEGKWIDAVTGAETLLVHPQGQPHWHVAARLTLATIARHRGEYRRAWREVNAVFPDGPATRPGISPFLETIVILRIAVALSLDSSDLVQAREWLEAHDHWLEYSGAVLGRAEGLLLWAELHSAEGDYESAQRCAEKALEHASEPRRPMALVAIHRFLGELATRSGAFEAAEAYLTASQQLSGACGFPFEQALTMLAQAELLGASGDFEKAETLLENARETFNALEARPALQRAAATRARLKKPEARVEYPDGLTRREVEVLRLMAAGKTTREIADELFLSRRTIERHIANIYTKTDLHTKAEAAIYAVQRELL